MTSGAHPLTHRILIDGVQDSSKRQIVGGEQMHIVGGNQRHPAFLGNSLQAFI